MHAPYSLCVCFLYAKEVMVGKRNLANGVSATRASVQPTHREQEVMQTTCILLRALPERLSSPASQESHDSASAARKYRAQRNALYDSLSTLNNRVCSCRMYKKYTLVFCEHTPAWKYQLATLQYDVLTLKCPGFMIYLTAFDAVAFHPTDVMTV